MKSDTQFSATLKSIRHPLLVVTWSAALAVTLQGCLPVMVGGTVMGAMTVSDRRSLGSQADDTSIVLKA
jgi:osmotically-inducible protein OsmY